MRHSGTNYQLSILVATTWAMIAGGCNSLSTSGIDPTGEHVFIAPPVYANQSTPTYQEPPLEPLPWDTTILMLSPSVTVAPVGSEVVLIAGVGAADGYLRCNQRLEWSIAPGSVGQFVDVGKNDLVDVLMADFNSPRIVNSVTAIGSTSSKDVLVKRGPASPVADVSITAGQGWIKVASPVEGTSIVNVVAPKIINAAGRMKTATVHWSDSIWRFPPPAINPAGSKHVLTTTVMRQTNQSPLPGWRVKYTITGGPPAGFSPDGASSIEATTDAAGQANVEIFQKSPAHGTNQIGIEVIRPAELPGAGGQRMTVGTGSTMQTWTAADIAVKLGGPSMTQVGGTLTYRLDISNPGDLPSKNILVTDILPDGLGYISSNPPAAISGKQLRWQLSDLGPRQRQTIEINVRAEKEGSVSNCAEVMTAAGLKVSDCATTTIMAVAGSATAASPAASAPPVTASLIDLQVLGPGRATVGSEVTFDIIITNRSQSSLNNLIVKDRFEPGLEHPASKEKKVIEYPLGELAGGKRTKLNVTFRATQAGDLCHTVEIIRQDTVLGRKRACVPVSAQSEPAPGIAPPGVQNPSRTTPGISPGATPEYRPGTPPAASSPSATARLPVISVKHTGPQPPQRNMGDVVLFNIQITNPNNRPLSNLKAVYRFDPAFEALRATEGCQAEGGNLMWVIPLLPAGSQRQLEVECRCAKAAANACNTVNLSSSEGAQAQAEACLEIRPAAGATSPGGLVPDRPGGTAPEQAKPPGDLTMTVTALRGPVAAGKELTYQIQVVNNSNTDHRQVTVTALVPDGMIPTPLGTTGPGPTQFVIDHQTVSFNPVMVVHPGETLTYRVRVRTKSAGQFRLRAELTSQNLTQPSVREADTEVF